MRWILGLLIVVALPAGGHAADLVKDSNNPAAWTFEAYQLPGGATMRLDAGALRCDITRNAAQPWYVQLFQAGKTLRDGAVYTLRFTAKASANRPILINVQMDRDPWRTLLDTQPTVNLTTQWRTYAVELRLSNSGGTTVRLPLFILGQATGTVWIRDVSVTDGASAASAPGRPASFGLAVPDSGSPAGAPRQDPPTTAPAPAPAGTRGEGGLLGPLATWRVDAHDTAEAAVQMLNGIAQATVTKPGHDRWNVQLFQIPDGLAAGQPYALTLGIRSDTPRKITFMAQHDQEPYDTLLPVTELNIGPEWKQYTLKFSLSKIYPGHTRLALQIGDTPGKVELRTATLVEATAK